MTILVYYYVKMLSMNISNVSNRHAKLSTILVGM